ncbi:hypothetical protein WMF04_50180 [Sorangium sp. So ce260]|uniref:hypothetical protein n=1 Tax=Sorangium sp. So ce260 TaxID=3133291 RepID=UPI003F5E1D47
MTEPIFRLDSLSPTLAERLRKASPQKCRLAAVVACELASASAGLSGQEVALALGALRCGAAAPPFLQQRLERLAAQLDDEYLRLEQEGDPSKNPESLRVFSKARATSALVFALSNDSAQLHEAIYEAIAAMSDPDELVRAAERELQ